MNLPLVGVAAIPNQCAICGRFKRWADLITHFVPDSDYSSENESWRECKQCRSRRDRAKAQDAKVGGGK